MADTYAPRTSWVTCPRCRGAKYRLRLPLRLTPCRRCDGEGGWWRWIADG